MRIVTSLSGMGPNAFFGQPAKMDGIISRRIIRVSIRLTLLFLAELAMAGEMRALAAQPAIFPFTHNGYSRPYLVYKPEHLPPHPAVVFMLGGTGSSARQNSEEFGWQTEADLNNFLVVFPELLPRQPDQPFAKQTNTTFWDMQGSRTHLPPAGMLPVDDDGYLMAVLRDVLHRNSADPKRIYFAGFSSGSGMVQLLAARHSKSITAIVAVATPLMEPPVKLAHSMPVLYIHGDNDEQFSGFEVNSPNFATTPHGNWVTWGYLNGCQVQRAEKTAWGVQLSWQGCRDHVSVIADFIAGFGHEWLGSKSSTLNRTTRPTESLNFTHMAWQFFANAHSK
ncbi:alpha/beta hydrolase family esterase [Tunturiibacter gelidoferens]|uniref:Polyhydroxybutyrate depolymerase n=1 Tax=Tunturiibacter lichenicola TaxID=2051959 RepID=A0A7Y9T1X5_9BACT|nr:PHB depolymerase family esterase [Edaphobacter lichenicola]NYF50516.1 polyhydroxybutyrate depolymerase [Edaphobacter lichenicola]